MCTGDKVLDFFFMVFECGVDVFNVETGCALELGEDKPEHETGPDFLVEWEPGGDVRIS